MGTTDIIINALKNRDPYIEFQTMSLIGNVDAEINKAYAKDPRLFGCIASWSGNRQAGQGLLRMQTVYRITLSYIEDLPPYNEILLDDGKWKPSEEFKKSGWQETVWIVTDNETELTERIRDDCNDLWELQPTYRGYSMSYYAEKRSSMKLYIIHFQTVVSLNEGIQYTTLAERQVQLIISRFFGGNWVMKLPPIIRVFMAFSYLQQNCEFNAQADSSKDDEKPTDPWAHTAFGPLCRGSGIAVGIADAYRMLLSRLGVSCKLVHGKVQDDDDTVDHAWCILRIGNEWFHSDPTYGVNGPNVDVTRFILNDHQAHYDYLWDEDLFPACIPLRPNYTDVSNYVDQNLGQMISKGIEERYISDDYVD